MNQKLIFGVLTAGSILFTGCGGSVASGGGTVVTTSSSSSSGNCPAQTTYLSAETTILGKEVCQLNANILSDLILTNDKIWSLGDALVRIGDDATNNPTLTIQSGTTLYGKVGGALVVQRGAKIQAIGTASAPIIMTGEADLMLGSTSRGQWAGVVIAGKAPNNNPTTEVAFEFDATILHGGTDTADSSGAMKYVVVKHAGQPIQADQEFNTITLGSVGSGTTIDYVEAYNGKDDGIELFGGNVNMSHLVLIGNDDDQLDTDEGYNGYVQYVYAETTTSGEKDPSAFEFSNTNSALYGGAGTTAYFAEPKVANFTIVGAPLANMNANSSFKYYNGIRTKDETYAKFVNGEISGFSGIEADPNSGMWRHQNDGVGQVTDVTMDGMFLDASGDYELAFATAKDANATEFYAAGSGNSYGDVAVPTATPAADEQAILGGTFIQTNGTIGAGHATWATGWAVKADGTNF